MKLLKDIESVFIFILIIIIQQFVPVHCFTSLFNQLFDGIRYGK